MSEERSITIRRPDDFHLHLRDDPYLVSTVRASARHFARAIVMPNLKPPITDIDSLRNYRSRIEGHLGGAYPEAGSQDSKEPHGFTPLMTIYLTGDHTPESIQELYETGEVTAFKLYPAGATTHSDQGISRIEDAYPLFEKMEELGAPLLIHAEVTDSDVDIFDREAVFVELHLRQIVERFTELKVVFEHVSSRHGVQYVENAPKRVAATITPHHLLMDRNWLFQGGLNGYHYCLPVVKTAKDRGEIVRAATSGITRFFAGTDSAPHPLSAKNRAEAAAGIYSAPVALSVYAAVFEQAGKLDNLEAFLSENGAAFYGLEPNDGSIKLVKRDYTIEETLPLGERAGNGQGQGGEDNRRVRPLMAGETLSWSVAED